MAPPGYLLVLGHSLNGEKMTRYSATLPPIYEKYGGFYLGIGGSARGVEHLEGPWFDHSLVLARFKSPDDITKFWFSPEYEDSKKLRESPHGEPAFLVSVYRVLDAEAFAPFAQAEADKLAHRSVPYIARSTYDEAERLEGDLIDHDFAVAAFPTQTSATSFWNDPGHKELREARAQSAVFNTFLVRGQRR